MCWLLAQVDQPEVDEHGAGVEHIEHEAHNKYKDVFGSSHDYLIFRQCNFESRMYIMLWTVSINNFAPVVFFPLYY